MKNEAKKEALKKLITAMRKRMVAGKPDKEVGEKDTQEAMVEEPEESEESEVETEEDEEPRRPSGIVTISIGAMKNHIAKTKAKAKAKPQLPMKAKK